MISSELNTKHNLLALYSNTAYRSLDDGAITSKPIIPWISITCISFQRSYTASRRVLNSNENIICPSPLGSFSISSRVLEQKFFPNNSRLVTIGYGNKELPGRASRSSKGRNSVARLLLHMKLLQRSTFQEHII